MNERNYSTIETVFAWLCFAIGYAFCRVFPAAVHPLGAALLVIGVFITTAAIICIKGGSLKGLPLAALITAILAAVTLLFTSNGFLHFFAYSYCIAAYGYFIYTAFGNAALPGWNDLFFLDFIKALLIAPFHSFFALFQSLFAKKGKLNGRFLLKIFAGIAMAVVPTAIIISLLSYDSGFTKILADLLDFGFADLFAHIGSLILGIPVGMYIYGLFISSADQKCCHPEAAENWMSMSNKIRRLPDLTAATAVLPILAVYVLFFISQWKYYISGFMGVLPESLSYAEYAREGFFQLCAVSVINFMIIALLRLFTKRKTEKPSPLQRSLAVILSVFTLVLIATAIAKMVLYIDFYGLTPKRVYATWFMAVLAILFLLMIAKQFILKLRTVITSSAVVVCAFILLSFANTDAIIAEYNAKHYLSGELAQFDAEAMSRLGDSALPSMVKLAEAFDKKFGSDLLHYEQEKFGMNEEQYRQYTNLCTHLKEMARYREEGFWGTTLPKLKADKALEECGLTQWAEEQKELNRLNKYGEDAEFYQEY